MKWYDLFWKTIKKKMSKHSFNIQKFVAHAFLGINNKVPTNPGAFNKITETGYYMFLNNITMYKRRTNIEWIQHIICRQDWLWKALY